MAIALEQLVKQLTDSSIIDPGKLGEFIPPKSHPKDADELARELVKQNQLTKFQAQQILAGRVKALILGNYTIIDKIGAGGMGQVYKAEHRRMKRLVAIKMLPPATVKDAAALARFQREVKAAAKLSHPNIVAAHDADEANGVHFLVMEFVEGRDLSATVKKDGPLPAVKAIRYIAQAARGLEYAHKKGVVHRDIKPANLLLDADETVKILDMGLARIEGDGAAAAELTGTGAVMGTVDYMAPEQALSTKHADARADIYSLGCSLYYLITGSPVYDGETVTAKLIAHQGHAIPSIKDVAGVPPQLDAVFQRMVAKRVDDRYQTMADVVADLESCLAAIASGTTIPSATWTVGATIASSDLSIALSNTPLRSIDAPEIVPAITIEPKTARKPQRTKRAAPARGESRGAKGPPWYKNRKLVVAAGGAWFVLLALAIVVIIRNKQGVEVARVKVPSGGKVEVQSIEASGVVGSGADAFFGAPPPITTYQDPAFKKWMAGVMVMSAEKQIKAVSKKLVELNPKFGGRLSGLTASRDDAVPPKIENGAVTELSVVANELLDLSPLRALSRLTSLWCEGRGGRVALRDISPLAGLPLTKLSLFQTSVADLSPLRGMPLEMLAVQVTPVSDLSPLAGMPLTDLNCSTTKVADLSPLRGMKLTILRCYAAQISDLSPLAGMPIKSLYAGSLPIRDLAPLAGMPLETLWIERTAVEDLSPLQQCKNLKSLKISNDRISTSQVAALQAALPQCKVTWEGPTAASNASTTTAGYALDFSPERKSYVEVPEWKYDGTTPLTVEAWVVPRGAATTQVVIEPVEAEGQTGFIPSLMISSSKKWRFTFASGKIVESNETINNRLAHLAGVFDGYQISLFLNGKQQRKPVSVDEPVEPAMLSLGLGARQRSARQLFFDGTIDEVRISNVARYTSDFTPAARFDPDDQTEVLYHFDEGSGTVARDASSHHRDGTISGATWVASNETRPLGSGSAAQYIPAGPSVDLLKHIDLAKAEVDFKGKPRWVWGDKVPGLLCQTSNSSTHLPIDYPAPEAYVIDARIIPRTEGRMRQVRFGLRTGEQRFFLDVDAHDNGKNQDPGPWSGLSMIDGAPAGRNETAVKATMLTPDKPLTIRIEVRPDAILVAFDGKSVVEYRGEMTRLSLPRVGTITDKSAQLGDLWLMSHESTLFESLTLTPLKPADGRGTAADSKAPPPAVAPFDATQAHAHQVAWSQYLGVPVKRKNSIGMAMMLIPPGEFLMGSTPEQIDYQRSRPSDDDEKRQDPATLSSEGPQHRVTLTKPFLIGATEVTLGQFGVFVEATKYVTEKERGTAIGPEKDDRAWNVYQGKRLENADLAVVEVTWNDAVAFCDWLSKKENATYRLPTEAEWEFACRAGTTTAYSFGNGEGVVNYAWVNDPANGPTRPVAEKLPNPFDLYDMHGHVAEFCQDRYGKNYYESSPLTDPIGPADGSTRVVRGGSWYAKPDFARSAARQNKAANYRLGYLGFRVVREIPPVAADLKAQGSDLKSDPNAASPLDALKREDIPPEELKAAGLGDPARAPAELVGVPVFYKPSAESWSGSARGMALSADGMTLVVTNDAARMLSVWDARSKKMSSTFPANRVATIYGMAFSPDGKTLATGDSMGIVKLWNVATRTPTATLSGHTDAVISVAFSPDGKRLASGARQIDGKDGSVRVWDVATGTERLRIAPELHDAHLAFSPDGGMLAVAGFGDTGSVRLRDPATGEELGRLDGASVGNSLRVAFSPDGRAVAAIKGSSVLVWDVPSRKRTRQLQVGTAYKSAVQDLAFHSDCRVIATVANDGCLRLWDTSTGNEIKSWQLGPPDGVIYRVQFDPTGRYLYTSNGNSSVYVLRLDAKAESGKPKAETSANAHRTAAEFVLSQGGTVAVRVGGTTIGKINSADKLPGGDFNVTAMDLSRVGQDDASAISDADVERLMALKTLEYLNINGRHELTIHVARILAESHLKVLLIGDVGVNDEWLEILSGLRTLDRLEIVPSAGITDRGLLHLEQLTKLKTLDLAGTKVTAAGMAKLQQALPNCKIEWDGAAKR